MSVLAEILESTRLDVQRRRRAVPQTALEAAGDVPAHAFRDALAGPGIAIGVGASSLSAIEQGQVDAAVVVGGRA